MIEFTNPEFTVKVGRFDAIVRTSYQDGGRDLPPTVFATVQGDEQNFVCTAGTIKPIYEADEHPGCKGNITGFEVVEKWGGEASAYHTDFVEAMLLFGARVASQLR